MQIRRKMNTFDIPNLDFDEKPTYSKHKTSITAVFRLKVCIKFSWQFLVVLFRTLYFGGFKSVLVKRKGTHNPIIEDGIYVSRLENSIISKLEGGISQTKQDLLSSRASISKRSFSDNQSAIRGDSLNSLIDILNSSEEVKRMLEMAKDWFSSDRASISRLTLQINDVCDNAIMSQAISDDDINTDYMHLDAAIGQLKFIVYMSDVEEVNGPTSYVPSTNKPSGLTFRRLVGASVDNLGFSGDTDMARLSFMALPRILRYKANFGNDLTPNCELSNFLLNNERKIIGPTGTAFLFDPSGVHRGALLKESTRTILQIQIRIS
jgi:hypothetical protein